jgi:thymidylate kinase
MYVVMLNGHVACLKTTRFLELRDQRYQIAAQIAEAYLKRDVSIILDGNYALRRWRKQIYDLAATYGASDVIAVTCTCSRPEVVRERLAYRRRVSGAPDAAANIMEAYWGSIEDFEPIENDRLPDGSRPSHLEFDSGTFKITARKCSSQHAKAVAAVLQYLVSSGRLAKPLFTSPDPSSIALSHRTISGRLWIELEGISGSGKTTQCYHLAAALRSAFPDLRIVAVGEFSATFLGDFLRSCLVHGLQLKLGQGPPSLLECLTVLADTVQKGETFARDDSWDVVIFDEYRWSRIAHTLASTPLDVDDEARKQVQHALEILINRFPPLPGEGITFFLDCPVEVAIRRLERRHGSSFGAEYPTFLRRLETAYRDILATNPDIYQIDATRPEEAVTQDMLRILKNQMGRGNAS